MTNIRIIGLLLIILNFFVSYRGFVNFLFFDNYKFEVDKILVNRDYKRLVTSGFLHVGWSHLIFNMISLYFFAGLLEAQLGGLYFAIIYFASLIGGDLLALLVHRQHGDYSAVGASGAVCGIIFASIALFPGFGISFFGLPFSIPGWLYGVLFVAYSIYGIKSNKNNIGHEAHLGGALVGMLVALIIYPSAILENYLPVFLIIIPTVAFIYLIVTRPQILYINNFFFKTHRKYYNIDEKYNEQKLNKQKELDRLLDKISKKGMNSLTAKEKQQLEEYSKS
jgi:membrane associated rhomboid family serine protease